MRLLIADSDPTLTDIYESFFSNEGYEVVTVGDGLECLNATRKRVPDVLILEYELPWGGGDGVLASLRREFPFMPIDVVLITCDYSEGDLAHELGPPVGGWVPAQAVSAARAVDHGTLAHTTLTASNHRRIAQRDDRSPQKSSCKLAEKKDEPATDLGSTEVSPAGCRRRGYTPEELVARNERFYAE